MSLKETQPPTGCTFKRNFCLVARRYTCGPLNGHHQQLVSVLGMVRIERSWPAGVAFRPPCERRPGEGFIAKAVFNIPTTTC